MKEGGGGGMGGQIDSPRKKLFSKSPALLRLNIDLFYLDHMDTEFLTKESILLFFFKNC